MFFFLWIELIICSITLSKRIPSKKGIVFKEIVNKDDLELNLYMYNNSKKEGLRCRIVSRPLDSGKSSKSFIDNSDSEDYDVELEKEILDSENIKLEHPNIYYIEIHNRSGEALDFTITSDIQKVITDDGQNKDLIELKNILESLRSVVNSMESENYYLSSKTTTNINELKSANKIINCMVLFPIITLIVTYVKYNITKQLIKPQSKRFKGLFK